MEFPKSARVLTRRDYLRFFEGSQARRLGVCTIYQLQSEGLEARLGITVKARTNSVYRNKLKRQIRESFRLNRKNLGSSDFNVVIPGNLRVDAALVRKVRAQLDSNWGHDRHF